MDCCHVLGPGLDHLLLTLRRVLGMPGVCSKVGTWVVSPRVPISEGDAAHCRSKIDPMDLLIIDDMGGNGTEGTANKEVDFVLALFTVLLLVYLAELYSDCMLSTDVFFLGSSIKLEDGAGGVACKGATSVVVHLMVIIKLPYSRCISSE